ncbi:MAG TPA: hypothetical protein PLZ57_11520 [Pseudobdellovibrionaceae bacterium]|nr:hypothetical protein [Pseudobdellovibrionaceae bacterium]
MKLLTWVKGFERQSFVPWIPSILFFHAATLWLRPLATWVWQAPTSADRGVPATGMLDGVAEASATLAGSAQFVHATELVASGEWTRWTALLPAAGLALWMAWRLRPQGQTWPVITRRMQIEMALTCAAGLLALRELNGGLMAIEVRYFPHFEVMSWWILAWLTAALACGARWTTPILWRGASAILAWGYFAAAWAKLEGVGLGAWLEGGVIQHLVTRSYLISNSAFAESLFQLQEQLPIWSWLAAATLLWEIMAPIGFFRRDLSPRFCRLFCVGGVAFHFGVWQASGINFLWPWAILYVVVIADLHITSAAPK